MREMLKKVWHMFATKKKYTILKLDPIAFDKGFFLRGVLKGGLMIAEVLDETEKTFRLSYTRVYLREIDPSQIFNYDEWILKTDERIVDIFER